MPDLLTARALRSQGKYATQVGVAFSCGDRSSELLPVARIRGLRLHRAAITGDGGRLGHHLALAGVLAQARPAFCLVRVP
jgi:hypothetical protein